MRKQQYHQNRLRIIGGHWRGRKLQFPQIAGLRPTPDRIRETLFNWLQANISASRCLDLYCGSGALGLESLSRGAAEVVFVDHSQVVQQQLKNSLEQLKANELSARYSLVGKNTLAWLAQQSSDCFDIVFVDPPYSAQLQIPTLQALRAGQLVDANSLVYCEFPNSDAPAFVEGWRCHRSVRAGDNCYALLQPEWE